MKKTILTLCLTSLLFCSYNFAVLEGERCLQTEEAVKHALYDHIDARGLKALIDTHSAFVLLDARGQKWHDNTKISGASMLYYEDSDEEFDRLIPNKDTLIVIYCYSSTCPLSGRLANKLLQLGYSNLVEYPGGLKEWRDIANYPVDTIQQ